MTAQSGLTTVIDWAFIADAEKEKVLVGYVPKNNAGEVIGKSGVTIATGFDLGSKDENFLINTLQLPTPLVQKLFFYIGKKKEDAVTALTQKPLVITRSEAEVIDNQMRFYTLKMLARDWYRFSPVPFNTLPKEVKTVLFSLAYNFGSIKAIPKTMKIAADCALRHRWEKLYTALVNFPSKNLELVKRRKKEAEYLRTLFT